MDQFSELFLESVPTICPRCLLTDTHKIKPYLSYELDYTMSFFLDNLMSFSNMPQIIIFRAYV